MKRLFTEIYAALGVPSRADEREGAGLVWGKGKPKNFSYPPPPSDLLLVPPIDQM